MARPSSTVLHTSPEELISTGDGPANALFDGGLMADPLLWDSGGQWTAFTIPESDAAVPDQPDPGPGVLSVVCPTCGSDQPHDMTHAGAAEGDGLSGRNGSGYAADGGDAPQPLEGGPSDGYPVSTYALAGTNTIDSLLSGAYKWGGGLGTGVTLTYSFGTSSSSYISGYSEPTHGFAEFSEAQKEATRTALRYWSNVADITFVEVTDSGTVAGDLRFARSSDPGTAWGYLPTSHPKGGDVWVGLSSNYNDMSEGTYGFQTMLHEIGHALGLKHPHEGSIVAETAIDWVGYSVMSYRSFEGASTGYRQDLYPNTPMINDIAAIQYLYGANTTHNSDDTSYSWSPGASLYQAIWDAGGTDTIDWSNQSSAGVINLTAGEWSQLGPSYIVDYTVWPYVQESRTLMIANGATIENAIGGSGSDAINGNVADNMIEGGAGDDTLSGGAGDDVFVFDIGFGHDTIADFVGGAGSPDALDFTAFGVTNFATLMAGTADVNGDAVITFGGNTVTLAGVTKDQLHADDFVGVLNGGTIGDDVLSGSDGVDEIYGEAGNDLLDGGAGDDTLYGNAGDDTLVGGAGSDAIYGGAGIDTADYGDSTAGVTANLSGLAGAGGEADGDTLFGIENVIGSAYDDVLQGDSAANILSGGNGADRLLGGPGDDTLNGEAGDDTLAGGAGNDSLVGGSGSDTFVFGTGFGEDIIADFAAGSASADRIDITPFGFQSFASLLENVSEVGSDSVIDLSGNTLTLTGVAKADLDADDFVGISNDGTAGDDAIDGTAGSDAVQGFAGRDSLNGRGGEDSLYGGAGNDTLDGGAGADFLHGGAGTDVASFANSASGVTANLSGTAGSGGDADGDILIDIENIDGSGHDDVLQGNSVANVLQGGEGDDRLLGAPGEDTLDGGAGNDTIDGGSDNDILEGGLGDDTYIVDSADDVVVENTGEGTDLIMASIGYTLVANVENLTLTGSGDIDGAGNDEDNTFRGNAGDNVLTGNAGADALYGGGGMDTASYAGSAAAVTVNLWGAAGSGGDAQGDRLFDIEKVVGSNFDDLIQGNGAANILDGGAGRDRILAGPGDDTLIGGANDDVLDGGSGNDSMSGGLGDDSYVVESTGDVISEGAGEGSDLVQASVDYTLSANVENLTLIATGDFNGAGNDLDNVIRGNAGDNVLTGGEGADTIYGGSGNDTASYAGSASGVTVNLSGLAGSGGGAAGDTLFDIENLIGSAHDDVLHGNSLANNLDGGLGNDRILAGPGNDTLTGAAGDDTLAGGAGADVLTGGDGDDWLSGGAGADRFVYAAMGDAGDLIVDFAAGSSGDDLDVSALLDGFGYAGLDPFADGYLRVVQAGADTVVQVDTDGGGNGYVTLLTLQNVTAANLESDNWTI